MCLYPCALLSLSVSQPSSCVFVTLRYVYSKLTLSLSESCHQQSNAVAGPSSPPSSSAVPSTPAPLSLEQQHITAVEGIVPTLQNIVATVISIADSTSRQLPCTPAMPNTTLRYVYSKLTLSLSESCAYIHVRFFPSAFPSRHHAYS